MFVDRLVVVVVRGFVVVFSLWSLERDWRFTILPTERL